MRVGMRRSVLGFVIAAALAAAGCPATADDLCAKAACEAAADAGVPDSGAEIVVAPQDPCVDRPRASDCVDEKSALFVAKGADPSVADGTVARPFPRIQAAIEKATDAKKRIYVCEGTYEEQVTIERLPVTIIGGLACDFRSDAPKPLIAPPSGIAFAIAAVGGASVLDLAVRGSSQQSDKGGSAIGMFVTRSTNTLLRRVEIVAGAGQPGEDGALGTQNWSGAAASANNGAGTAGGEAPACGTCADGVTSSAGGQGGSAAGAGNLLPGDGKATPPVGGENKGTNQSACVPGTGGANGLARAAALGGTRSATLAATSFSTETNAEAGPIGNPGQGGGGGGANASLGGGSGGCGGCGGGGGGPGKNGGSSIALLVFESVVTLEGARLTAEGGGKGGRGGDGLDGQAPSIGGSGVCGGGAGGYGGGGGGGGGGAGGHSAAIAHVGAAPSKDDATDLVHGAAGEGGAGGGPGAAADPSGNAGNAGGAGAKGAAVEILAL